MSYSSSSLLGGTPAKQGGGVLSLSERASVTEFYRLNHQGQMFTFVQAKKADYLPKTRAAMSIWDAMEFLNTLVDDRDPDTEPR